MSSTSASEPVAGLHATRWRRYGKDRLYFRDAAGAEAGWWDLVTDTSHEVPVLHLAQAQCLASEAALQVKAPRKPAVAPAATPIEPVPPPRPVSDIAFTAPGAQLAPRAQQEGADSSWAKGIMGENVTAQRLYEIRCRNPWWSFLNSVALNESVDIDHILMGPGGLFTINSKYTSGNVWVGGSTLMVGGSRHPYIHKARAEAARASRLLSNACNMEIDLHPLLVFVGEGKLTIREAPLDVTVLTQAELSGFIDCLPVLIAEPKLRHILDTARRSDTWQRPAPRRAR